MHRHWPRALIAFTAATAALLSATRAPDVGARVPARSSVAVPPVHVRILGINDLHGHLEPTAVDGRQAGGVAWLASALDRASSDGTPTIRVTAGDSPGASPLISARFGDVPTAEALNLMHFDVGTLGNHDFDKGPDAMRKLVGVANFPYIAANVLDARTEKPLLPPYVVVQRAGVKIGFIGVTTTSSGRWLMPEYRRALRFTDISDTVNTYARELEAQGVHAIVVLAHAGGVQDSDSSASGEIVDETRQMSDSVDAVVAGHTHTLMDLRVGHKVLTQAICFGMAFDRIDLSIDPTSDEVVSAGADVDRVWDDELSPDARLSALVAGYRARLGALATRPVADLPAAIARMPGPDGPNELGYLVAESQREAAHADMAFVAPDWVRADLPAGPVTYADVRGPAVRQRRGPHDDVGPRRAGAAGRAGRPRRATAREHGSPGGDRPGA